jgi:hypothetical protein
VADLAREHGVHVMYHTDGAARSFIPDLTDSVRLYQHARWVCAPCHRLQPVTPTANIVALYETIHSLG